MNEQLLKSIQSNLKNSISLHVSNIKSYLNTPPVDGRDSYTIEKAIMYELDILSKHQSHANTLETYFLDNIQSPIPTPNISETSQPIINWDKESSCEEDNTPNWGDNFEWETLGNTTSEELNSDNLQFSIDNQKNTKTSTMPDWAKDIMENY